MRNIATNTDTQILTAFANEYVGLNFSPDANYLYFTRGTPDNAALHSLFVMPVFGGTPRQLIHDVDSAPSLSPDGSRFVYLRWTPDRKEHFSEIHSADKDGGDDQLLYTSTDQAQAPVWSPLGNQIAWIELNGPAATAIKILDIASKKTVTIPQPKGMFYDPNFGGYTDLAWLPDGRHLLVLYLKAHSDRGQIGVVGVADGAFHTVTNDVNAYSQLAISADGKTLATVLTNVDSSIAYYKGDGGAMISSTPLRITPNSLAWADEDHIVADHAGYGHQQAGTRNRNSAAHRYRRSGYRLVHQYLPGWSCFVYRNSQGRRRVAPVSHGCRWERDYPAHHVRALHAPPIARPDSQRVYFTIRPKLNIPTVSLWSVPLSGGDSPEGAGTCRALAHGAYSRHKVCPRAFQPKPALLPAIWDISTHQMAASASLGCE